MNSKQAYEFYELEQKKENEQRKKEYKNGGSERRKRSETQARIHDGAEEEKCVANVRIANKRTNFMMEQKEENEQRKKEYKNGETERRKRSEIQV